MRAQPAKAREWTCDHCGNRVPPGFAHKCLEFDRRGEAPTSGDVVYLWPSRNLREIAERIEGKAIEGAAETGCVLGFRHATSIRDIEAAFNVALHLRRIAAASADTLPKGGDAKQAPCVSKGSAVPNEDSGDAQSLSGPQ